VKWWWWALPALAVWMAYDKLSRWALAIAKAEGYHVAGSLPNRLNNPGSIKDPATGQLQAFPTPLHGFAALLAQLRLAVSGRSAYYRPDMTLAEFARVYTGGDNPEAWARTVAQELGVSTDVRIRELV
jgi:hypothetical protein